MRHQDEPFVGCGLAHISTSIAGHRKRMSSDVARYDDALAHPYAGSRFRRQAVLGTGNVALSAHDPVLPTAESPLYSTSVTHNPLANICTTSKPLDMLSVRWQPS